MCEFLIKINIYIFCRKALIFLLDKSAISVLTFQLFVSTIQIFSGAYR